ncbi:MAG: nucleotidyltransferase family protein, partial [Candidatus Dormibacteria bacterium]
MPTTLSAMPRRLRALQCLGRLLGDGPVELPEIRWRDTVLLADEQLLVPALAVALRARPDLAGPAVEAHLGQAHRRNLVRNTLLRRQSLQVMRSLNGVGIEPLLMKGALYFFDGTLPDVGARFTGDLDVVVPRGLWEDSIQALRAAGYVPDPGKAYMHPHELPIVAMGTPS